MNRLAALLKKEFRQMVRDRLNFFMLLVMPLLQLVLFGLAVETEMRHLPTVVWDRSGQANSQMLMKSLEESTYFNIVGQVDHLGAVEDLLAKGQVKVGLVIPADYGQRASASSVWLLTDGTETFTSLAALKGAQWVAIQEAQRLLKASEGIWSPDKGFPVKIEVFNEYNQNLLATYTMIPGLIGLILTMTMVMVTAMALVREKEKGTWEQLQVSPLTLSELFLGKIGPYLIVGYGQLSLALLVSSSFFQIPLVGSIRLLFGLTTLFLLASLGLGLLISILASTQMQAMQMSFLVFLPSVLLSGFLFPRESMPQGLQYLAYLLPLTYYLEILRGLMIKGLDFLALAPAVFTLSVFLIFLFGLSFRLMQKKAS